MRTEMQAKLHKIRKVSSLIRAICKVVMGFKVAEFLLVTVFLLSRKGMDISLHKPLFHLISLSLGRRLHLVVMIAISLGFLIKCLYHLHRLFGNYSRDEIFTSDSAEQLRQIGITYLIWSCISKLSSPLAFLSAHPPNGYEVDLHLNSIVIGVCIIVISWFMVMAVDMREENELTI
jgi:Protein of unknown function (DUF2975)